MKIPDIDFVQSEKFKENMNRTTDIIERELLKERVRGVTKGWRADETFTGDSTLRQHGYLPIDMGANIKDLESRINKLLCEFKAATNTDVTHITLTYTYSNVHPSGNRVHISVGSVD